MADRSPVLSRRRLNRILGLSKDPSPQQIQAAALHLLTRLFHRLSSADPAEADALRREMEDLEASSAHFISSSEQKTSGGEKGRRRGLVITLLGASLTIALLIAYAAGFRVIHQKGKAITIHIAEPAHLILDGKLTGAILRVFDSDREELFFKVSAEGAHVELPAGRYALDVRREDCPDHWTRSVYFEEGAIHRFEPLLCLGEGQLTVRSNVSRDRLRIDGIDLGPTRQTPHLLGVGDHEIRVEKPGYQPFVGKIRIRPGEQLTLRAELIAKSPAGSPTGRPIPVEKFSPSSAPLTALRPEPLDMPNMLREFTPEAEDLALPKLNWLETGNSSHAFTNGGSTPWHDRISAELLARYDLDASGLIDRLEESEAIPCPVWLEIERDFDGGGLGLSMVRYYGFDGSEWHPKALGFARAHRSAVFEKMKECGLQS